MPRPRRRAALAFGGAVLFASSSFAGVAGAEASCDAGIACLDGDGDGVMPCGCAPPGTRCDCDDDDPSIFPGAAEACDAPTDVDCSGVAGDRCPAGEGCLASTCVPACKALDDFGCAPGSGFDRQPNGTCLCKPQDCSVFGCPRGFTCDDAKVCVASCHPGVKCPAGQRCRGLGCVDPCAGVACPAGTSCVDGSCVLSCACTPGSGACPPGRTCDRSGPVAACVDEACRGVTCPAGQRCEGGACVDDCAGVVCPPKLVCRSVPGDGGTRASCVDLCSPSPCPPNDLCEWRTGTCRPRPTLEGGLRLDDETTDELRVAGAGFRCASIGPARVSAAALLFAATVLLVVRCRKRR